MARTTYVKPKREKKTMRHEEAPSGYVTLYNYKEPFTEYVDGHGYFGVLLFDQKSDRMQCHLCGEWVEQLNLHVRYNHSMSAADYKKKTGLMPTTALINEKTRNKMVSSGIERFKNLRVHKSHTEKTKKKIAKTLRQNRMEKRNYIATCPEQLLDRLSRLAHEVGRTPTQDEVGFIGTLIKTYGSYSRACSLAGLEPRKRGQNVNYKAAQSFKNFSDTQLLQLLIEFQHKHGRKPSGSDITRCLLPSKNTYARRFGSWKKALELACGE